jgi:hypothetical protein
MGRPSLQFDISGVPQCSTAKVGYVVYLDLIYLNPGLGSTSSHQSGRNPTVRLAKWKILVQMSISLFQNRMVNPCRKFSDPGFPHNFAKNDRQELKIGCTDASRRQLQSVLKIGV